MAQRLIVLIGAPASGKSTLANKLEGVVLSSDDIRYDLQEIHYGDRYTYRPELNQLVFHKLHKQIRTELNKGNHVIVDATNMNEADRKSYHDIKHDFGAQIELIALILLENIDTLIANDNSRPKHKRVGADVIAKSIERFTPLDYSKWDRIVHMPQEDEL